MSFALYFLLSWAGASTMPVVQCTIPDGPYTTADLIVEADSDRGDMVTLELKDAEVVDRFTTLTRSEAVMRQLRRGGLKIVLRGEKGRTVGSLTTDAALLVLDKGFDGRFQGRVSARGLVLELTCD